MDFRKITSDSIKYLKTASIAEQARLFIKLTKLHRLAAQNVWFNQQCKHLKVIPNYINIRTSAHSRAANLALKKAQNIWLNEEARYWFSIRDNLKSHIKILHSELSFSLHNIEFDILDQKAREFASQAVHKKYLSQISKLQRLTRDNTQHNNNAINPPHSFNSRVKNLTDTQFPHEEISLLEKGLKYNIRPKISQTNLETLAVDAEIAVIVGKKDDIVKHQIAQQIKKTSKFNINQGELKIYKSIQNRIDQNNLVVSKADKGNTIVVMERDSYTQKVNDVILGEDFIPLNIDPTNKYTAQLKKAIQNTTHITSDTNKFISSMVPMNPKSPIMYGLPKIHKENIPIRPVVSYIGAPAYGLAKYLNKIIKEKSNFSPIYSLKNSLDLVSKIKDISLPQNAKLLSLDVENLFTNVPYEECLNILHEHFEKQRLLPGEIKDLLDLTRLCMRQNYFKFNNKFYNQKEGLAMGSPLSPLMADIFMDNYENKYIVKNKNIIYYYRYVDDIIICWTGTNRQINLLVNKLNKLHPKIKFKLEIEENASLNFLDLTISRIQNTHDFQIYRKPTHTDTVIPASSCHPWQHKIAAFHSYIHRLMSVPLNKNNYTKELNIIYQIAVANGYDKQIIDNIINKKLKKHIRDQLYAVTTKPIHKYSGSLTYVGPISEQIVKTLRKNEIRVAFKTNNSLRQICNIKEKIENSKKSGVYKLVCDECNSVYIGQTGRNFETRYKEHISAQRHNHPEKSHFAKHLLDSGHSLSQDHTFNILHICEKGLRLCVLEGLEINKHKNNNITLLNEQINMSTSPLLRLFTKEARMTSQSRHSSEASTGDRSDRPEWGRGGAS